MLKKIVSMIVIAAFLLVPTVSVHAADSSISLPAVQASTAEISPMFVDVNRITASLSISSSGTARGMVNVFLRIPVLWDYILTTASLVNPNGN